MTDEELEREIQKVRQSIDNLVESDKPLPKEERMGDSLQRIKQQPHEIWMVKMADRIANLAPPPHDWAGEKIARYREEAIEIWGQLHEASKYLDERLVRKIGEYEQYV